MGNSVTVFDYLIHNPPKLPFKPPSFGVEPKFTAEMKDFTLICGQFSYQGDAEDQEDEIDIKLLFGSPSEDFQREDGTQAKEFASFIGLYDGHFGFHCSQFLVDKLASNLLLSKNYPQNIEKALKETFTTTDKEFLDYAARWSYKDGSSALVVHISKNVLHAASAGDSQGYLFEEGGETHKMSDNKPKRGMGHLPYKGKNPSGDETEDTDVQVEISGNDDDNTVLSPVPSVLHFDLSVVKAKFFVVGTWTFWNALSVDEVHKAVISGLQEEADTLEGKVANVARDLVFLAGNKDSAPNISCIVGLIQGKNVDQKTM